MSATLLSPPVKNLSKEIFFATQRSLPIFGKKKHIGIFVLKNPEVFLDVKKSPFFETKKHRDRKSG